MDRSVERHCSVDRGPLFAPYRGHDLHDVRGHGHGHLGHPDPFLYLYHVPFPSLFPSPCRVVDLGHVPYLVVHEYPPTRCMRDYQFSLEQVCPAHAFSQLPRELACGFVAILHAELL